MKAVSMPETIYMQLMFMSKEEGAVALSQNYKLKLPTPTT